MVYPYSSLKPIRDLLRSRIQAVDGDKESEKRWQAELSSAVGDSELEMRVIIGHIKATLNSIDTMKENDVLYFKKNEFARVMINDIPTFDARIGTSGPNVAIKIETILDTLQER